MSNKYTLQMINSSNPTKKFCIYNLLDVTLNTTGNPVCYPVLQAVNVPPNMSFSKTWSNQDFEYIEKQIQIEPFNTSASQSTSQFKTIFGPDNTVLKNTLFRQNSFQGNYVYDISQPVHLSIQMEQMLFGTTQGIGVSLAKSPSVMVTSSSNSQLDITLSNKCLVIALNEQEEAQTLTINEINQFMGDRRAVFVDFSLLNKVCVVWNGECWVTEGEHPVCDPCATPTQVCCTTPVEPCCPAPVEPSCPIPVEPCPIPDDPYLQELQKVLKKLEKSANESDEKIEAIDYEMSREFSIHTVPLLKKLYGKVSQVETDKPIVTTIRDAINKFITDFQTTQGIGGDSKRKIIHDLETGLNGVKEIINDDVQLLLDRVNKSLASLLDKLELKTRLKANYTAIYNLKAAINEYTKQYQPQDVGILCRIKELVEKCKFDSSVAIIKAAEAKAAGASQPPNTDKSREAAQQAASAAQASANAASEAIELFKLLNEAEAAQAICWINEASDAASKAALAAKAVQPDQPEIDAESAGSESNERGSTSSVKTAGVDEAEPN